MLIDQRSKFRVPEQVLIWSFGTTRMPEIR